MSAESTQLLLLKGMLTEATDEERELVEKYRLQTLAMLKEDPHAGVGVSMATLEFIIEQEKK